MATRPTYPSHQTSSFIVTDYNQNITNRRNFKDNGYSFDRDYATENTTKPNYPTATGTRPSPLGTGETDIINDFKYSYNMLLRELTGLVVDYKTVGNALTVSLNGLAVPNPANLDNFGTIVAATGDAAGVTPVQDGSFLKEYFTLKNSTVNYVFTDQYVDGNGVELSVSTTNFSSTPALKQSYLAKGYANKIMYFTEMFRQINKIALPLAEKLNQITTQPATRKNMRTTRGAYPADRGYLPTTTLPLTAKI